MSSLTNPVPCPTLPYRQLKTFLVRLHRPRARIQSKIIAIAHYDPTNQAEETNHLPCRSVNEWDEGDIRWSAGPPAVSLPMVAERAGYNSVTSRPTIASTSS